MRLSSTVGLSFCLENCFKEYVDFTFSYFSEGFEVLNVIFQASGYVTIVTAIVYYNMYHY